MYNCISIGLNLKFSFYLNYFNDHQLINFLLLLNKINAQGKMKKKTNKSATKTISCSRETYQEKIFLILVKSG